MKFLAVDIDHSVTFGDILTLILSFFVLMVSLNQFKLLGGNAVGSNQPESNPLIEWGESKPEVVRAGPVMGWWLSEAVFDRDTLVPLGVSKLLADESKEPEVLVAVCSRTTTGEAWGVAEQRAHKLLNSMYLVGVPKKQISIRILGPHCGALGADVPSEAIATVRVF